MPRAPLSDRRASPAGVYGRMKNELLEDNDREENPLRSVLDASRDLYGARARARRAARADSLPAAAPASPQVPATLREAHVHAHVVLLPLRPVEAPCLPACMCVTVCRAALAC